MTLATPNNFGYWPLVIFLAQNHSFGVKPEE